MSDVDEQFSVRFNDAKGFNNLVPQSSDKLFACEIVQKFQLDHIMC